METYFQYPSGTGLRYPLSGQVVGALAEFLRLKGYLKDDWAGASYKTVQRYFQGDAIKPETVQSILDAMLDSLILTTEQGSGPWSAFGVNLRDWTRAFIGNLLKDWDWLAAESNGSMFPVVEERWLPYPLFRLLFLDLGIRWAGYLGLTKERHSDVGNCLPAFLVQDALRSAIDQLREQSKSPLTVEKLAERVDVSMNTMEAWRQGKSLPTNDHLVRLSSALAVETGKRLPDVELWLRLALGGTAVTGFLEKLCGAELAQDFIKALAKTARLTWKFLRWAPIEKEQWAAVMRELMEHGGGATIRKLLCPYLAAQCGENLESAADFMALAGQWALRMNYWAQRVRPVSEREAKSHWKGMPGELSEKEMVRFSRMFQERELRLTEFLMDEEDWQALNEKFPYHVTIRGEDIDPVGTYTKKGRRAHSLGDRQTALKFYYKALAHDRDNAALHYCVGCTLGEFVAHGQRHFLDEAIRECREAARLDPKWNAPHTEIAIILGNAGLIEEAEEAFERAEHIAAKWEHFQLTRANNLMWLERYQDAAKCFQKAIELHPAYISAWFGLAAAQYSLGDLRGVQQSAKKIRDLGGPVEADPSGWLKYIPRLTNPIVRRREHRSEVGPNEACTCGSGKKFKRCCGR